MVSQLKISEDQSAVSAPKIPALLKHARRLQEIETDQDQDRMARMAKIKTEEDMCI